MTRDLRVGDLAASWEQASPDFRLASLAAELAEVLRGSSRAQEVDLDDLDDLLRRAGRVAAELAGSPAGSGRGRLRAHGGGDRAPQAPGAQKAGGVTAGRGGAGGIGFSFPFIFPLPFALQLLDPRPQHVGLPLDLLDAAGERAPLGGLRSSGLRHLAQRAQGLFDLQPLPLSTSLRALRSRAGMAAGSPSAAKAA